jgi:hypothetical protein
MNEEEECRSVYKHLLRLVNEFVCIERGPLPPLTGKILDVDPEVVELQMYDRQGNEDSRWLIAIGCISAVFLEDRDLEELALTVKWAKSPDEVSEREA